VVQRFAFLGYIGCSVRVAQWCLGGSLENNTGWTEEKRQLQFTREGHPVVIKANHALLEILAGTKKHKSCVAQPCGHHVPVLSLIWDIHRLLMCS